MFTDIGFGTCKVRRLAFVPDRISMHIMNLLIFQETSLTARFHFSLHFLTDLTLCDGTIDRFLRKRYNLVDMLSYRYCTEENQTTCMF